MAQTRNNLFLNLSDRIKTFIGNLQIAQQKVDIATFVLVMGITLPVSALLYWRILLENFNRDYFSWCYSPDDAIYTLYEKGTILWYIILFMACLSVLALLFKGSKILIASFAIALIAGAIFMITKIGDFENQQIFWYSILLIIANFSIIYYNRNIIYFYAFFIGLYFVMADESDTKKALHYKNNTSVLLKSGHILLDKMDTTKVWVTSTSKFILIYNKKDKLLTKVERDSI